MPDGYGIRGLVQYRTACEAGVRGNPPESRDFPRKGRAIILRRVMSSSRYVIMHTVRYEVRTSSGRGSLDAPKREVRRTLKFNSVTASVCRRYPF